MAINVSVHYNGGFLPDIILLLLLTQGFLPSGNYFKCYGRGFVFVARVDGNIIIKLF